MANALAGATSPYLLQHQDNPVDWQEWSPAALAEAQRRDVPILLSVGYAACHWCHVMAHESFENEAIAAQMNRDFVNIKVDREERPDLDAVYQQALALLGQQGGWPLTMFLTPAGEPFWGGTYFPPEARYGRAGFPQVLDQLTRLWREERQKLDGNRAQLGQALAQLATPEPAGEIGLHFAIAAARDVARSFDAVHGGLGGAPKFPQAPLLGLLWRTALLTGDARLEARVLHTLRRICQGGIYDHLGGGFARYSVDAFWLVPHFEKMLYDNAQLLGLLAEAWAATRDELFKVRAQETVAWLVREMSVEGGFAAALDADSEGEEGRFYVWDEPEIERLLGADAPAFALAYGVTGGGNFEGHTILNRLHEPGLPTPDDEAILAGLRAVLLAAREERPRPARDDKLLADWNGLAVQGLAAAAYRFNRKDWLDLAVRTFDAVVERTADGDRLAHSYRADRRLGMGFLDDYAQMAAAAVSLYELTGEERFLQQAQAWLHLVDAAFTDGRGGFHQTAMDGEALIVRPRGAQDGPTPSANGTLAETSLRLFQLTGDSAHQTRAQGILSAFAGDVQRGPAAFGALLAAALRAAHEVQIVIVGEPDDDRTLALRDAAASTPLPAHSLRQLRPAHALPAGHPAHGKGLVAGAPAAYICTGPVCQAPVTDAALLAQRLRAAARLELA